MTVLVLLVVFVFKFAWLIGAVVATAMVGRLIGGWLAHRDDHALERRRRDAATAVRADQQQAWLAEGDARGLYGNYTPTVL